MGVLELGNIMRRLAAVAICALILVPVIGYAQDVPHRRVDLVGTPFPSQISLTGPAVSPSRSLRTCSDADLRVAQPVIDLVNRVVQAEGNRRTWSSLRTPSSVTNDQKLVATLVRTPNGSYVVQLDDSHIRDIGFLPAVYNCLNLRFGPDGQAAALGLLPAPVTDPAMPQYSPTLGFYRIINIGA